MGEVVTEKTEINLTKYIEKGFFLFIKIYYSDTLLLMTKKVIFGNVKFCDKMLNKFFCLTPRAL